MKTNLGEQKSGIFPRVRHASFYSTYATCRIVNEWRSRRIVQDGFTIPNLARRLFFTSISSRLYFSQAHFRRRNVMDGSTECVDIPYHVATKHIPRIMVKYCWYKTEGFWSQITIDPRIRNVYSPRILLAAATEKRVYNTALQPHKKLNQIARVQLMFRIRRPVLV
jgi:hypothetical protein